MEKDYWKTRLIENLKERNKYSKDEKIGFVIGYSKYNDLISKNDIIETLEMILNDDIYGGERNEIRI